MHGQRNEIQAQGCRGPDCLGASDLLCLNTEVILRHTRGAQLSLAALGACVLLEAVVVVQVSALA